MADSLSGLNIESSYEKYKSYFSDKDNSALDSADFLSLMVEQLKNQDFQNTTDTSQYLSQLADLTTVQYQQESAQNIKYSYGGSLAGKIVTVEDSSGATDVGYVSNVMYDDEDFSVTVNGVDYTSSQIKAVEAYSSDYAVQLSDISGAQFSKYSFGASLIGKNVTVTTAEATDDTTTGDTTTGDTTTGDTTTGDTSGDTSADASSTVTGTVTSINYADASFTVTIDGKEYTISQILSINN